MAKQVKIKDIALMAGVSAGTVDRILHNRGNVSQASRDAVEKVLAQVGYKFNIHASAISFRKEYNIIISTPTSSPGEYWGIVKAGIEHALEEYSDIRINSTFLPYNQFDIYSCKEAFGKIPDCSPDAVIIGPTFAEETRTLCDTLDIHGIPYVFVDSIISGTKPIATYTTDQYACGFLLGKLLHSMTPQGGEIAVFSTKRIGNQSANNSRERKKGLLEYLEQQGLSGMLKEASLSTINPEENEKNIVDFICSNPDVKGMAVLNSRGYIVADILDEKKFDGIKLISFDLTDNNSRCIKNGSIAVLLCQRPEMQGFNSVKSAIHYLLYKQKPSNPHHLMPVDIIMKENLPFYKEIYTE